MQKQRWLFGTRVIGAAVVSLFLACGGDPGTQCMDSPTALAAESFCAPMRIAANQPLRLQIREQCGGCTAHATQCQVSVSGLDVKLVLTGQMCTLSPETACATICSTAVLDCNVPALAPGTYRVFTPAGTSSMAMMTTDVSISATACSVP